LEAKWAEVPEFLDLSVPEIVGSLDGVVVADHVITENNVSLTGEVNGAGGDRGDVCVLQTSIVPVAVGADDGRESTSRRWFERSVEITGEVIAGERFDQYLLDETIPVLNSAKYLRMEIVSPEHRQQTGSGQNLGAQRLLSGLPFRQRLIGSWNEVRIGIRNIDIPDIVVGNLGVGQQRCGKNDSRKRDMAIVLSHIVT